jgi:hypothetical protein
VAVVVFPGEREEAGSGEEELVGGDGVALVVVVEAGALL